MNTDKYLQERIKSLQGQIVTCQETIATTYTYDEWDSRQDALDVRSDNKKRMRWLKGRQDEAHALKQQFKDAEKSTCDICGFAIPKGRVVARCNSCISLYYFYAALKDIVGLLDGNTLEQAQGTAQHALDKAPGGNKTVESEEK